ncbi:MAG TPA: RNA polymerase sigma-54 factor [Nitrospiraceae bacterium]|nr:MAG: RNA polymerase sigma-54 factor [Nitrospirae bacterium GWA2_46_11]OGW23954.1 MAG: RNA polymerase sigma-54 factor [Nitrospirae bacterium GWB2_47_37]HAK89326.1 RNA polymerase sigma-54 factor [Nitrospiraceae bacterium]HCZ12139.1 RNA polymerase sigma-54 factor [Nitrospiraceae bacterium]
MALENRLDLRLSQRLILTPQLQQAIKLLQMPQLELAQTLNLELVENPFLEEVTEEPETEEYVSEEEGSPPPEDDAEMPLEGLINFGSDEYFDERGSDGRDLGYFSPGLEEQPSHELFYAKKPDLYDRLFWQLRLCTADDEIRRVAEIVIGNIDDDGYLRATADELASAAGTDIDIMEAAISLVHSFDPPGIGARDLKECLLLQINVLNLGGTLVQRIIENNMEDLQKKRYSNIAKQYNSPMDDIITAVKIIEGLEPRPAVNFTGAETNYIVPDVFIDKTDEGYQIILNDDGMPRLRLNNTYRKLLLNKETLTKEEREFLKEKLRLAVELMKSLDQRNRTIYRVSESILKFQMEFFEAGVQSLRPLNLKDVAEDISMHESTISRVTSNKFLACNHGVFGFRFFFSSAIQSDSGDVSSTFVKDLIKKITAGEDAQKPLSDQAITDKLKVQSINIARRTVAKYREELKIPPQNQRKKYE